MDKSLNSSLSGNHSFFGELIRRDIQIDDSTIDYIDQLLHGEVWEDVKEYISINTDVIRHIPSLQLLLESATEYTWDDIQHIKQERERHIQQMVANGHHYDFAPEPSAPAQLSRDERRRQSQERTIRRKEHERRQFLERKEKQIRQYPDYHLVPQKVKQERAHGERRIRRQLRDSAGDEHRTLNGMLDFERWKDTLLSRYQSRNE